jgi:hypothetical protein
MGMHLVTCVLANCLYPPTKSNVVCWRILLCAAVRVGWSGVEGIGYEHEHGAEVSFLVMNVCMHLWAL